MTSCEFTGLLLHSKMKERGHSYRQVAKMFNVSHTEIANICKGKNYPSIPLAFRLCNEYLFISLDKFFGFPEVVNGGWEKLLSDNNLC